MAKAPDVWQEGFKDRGRPVDPLGRLPKKELYLGRVESLRVMSQEYVFFTPAILYLLGIVSDAPLFDFIAEYGQMVDFYWRKFRFPLFAGLATPDGDSDWNHALWAIRRQHWEPFRTFYCSLALVNPQRRDLHQVGLQLLTVVDPLALDRRGLLVSGRVPVVGIGAFGVTGNRFQAAFARGRDPLSEPPRLSFYRPEASVCVYADALHRGDNPHVARELFLSKRLKEVTAPNGARHVYGHPHGS